MSYVGDFYFQLIAAAMVVLASLAAASPTPFHAVGHSLGGLGDQEDGPHRSHSYHFRYAVHDPVTGDVKDQNEVSDGRGNVRGTYSMLEADGSKRVVEYTADDENGFQAQVKRIEPAGHAAVAPSHEYQHAFGPDRAVPSHPAPVHDVHEQFEHHIPQR